MKKIVILLSIIIFLLLSCFWALKTYVFNQKNIESFVNRASITKNNEIVDSPVDNIYRKYALYFTFDPAVRAQIMFSKYVNLLNVEFQCKKCKHSSGGMIDALYLDEKTSQKYTLSLHEGYYNSLESEDTSDFILRNDGEYKEPIDFYLDKLYAKCETTSKLSKSVKYQVGEPIKVRKKDIQLQYFNADMYYKGKLISKGMMGVVLNSKGNLLLVNSYAKPDVYSERNAIDFFTSLQLNRKSPLR